MAARKRFTGSLKNRLKDAVQTHEPITIRNIPAVEMATKLGRGAATLAAKAWYSKSGAKKGADANLAHFNKKMKDPKLRAHMEVVAETNKVIEGIRKRRKKNG